jgi:cytochrome c-type biogenesis protein CcmH/NrfG
MKRKFHKRLNKTEKQWPFWLKKFISGRVSRIRIFNECLKKFEKRSAAGKVQMNLKANTERQESLENELGELLNQHKGMMADHQRLTMPIKKRHTAKNRVSKIIWVLCFILLLIIGWTFYFIFFGYHFFKQTF